MSAVSVIIPWRAAPSRVTAFEAVTSWYAREFPEFTVRTIDTEDDVFVLAACRNRGIAGENPDDVVIINDADTVPEADALRAAVDAAGTSGLVHLPYTAYHWLGATGTAQYLAGLDPEQCEFELVRGACSGVYVTTPRTWERHGGQDERFRGWGYEDAAWNLAHQTLLGSPPQRHEGRVYALHHVAETRAGAHFDANAALMERYRGAAGDPGAMRSLVGERVPTSAS
ncbi:MULTISPECIES: glycosyltransferase family 2 protein [Microbacterium]|uniref:glycosyltransferase family 2 protein n=1 Tax=Microbacterium TaxID=33882 RepID=UPI000C2C6AC5|nr:hypothetical protein [Microbacterium lacus]